MANKMTDLGFTYILLIFMLVSIVLLTAVFLEESLKIKLNIDVNKSYQVTKDESKEVNEDKGN